VAALAPKRLRPTAAPSPARIEDARNIMARNKGAQGEHTEGRHNRKTRALDHGKVP